jgi:hypothetical protein
MSPSSSSTYPETVSGWVWSEGHMGWLLGLSRREYRELESGRLNISYELYERIVDVCGWPR